MTYIAVENAKVEQDLKVEMKNVKFSKIVKIGQRDYSGKVYDLKIDDKSISNYSSTDIFYLNGGGRRKGSAAIYLSDYHADVEDFIDIRKTHGKEEMRARDLFTAMWISDLFMKRVEADADWTLFSPDEAPDLHDVYDEVEGEAGTFTKLYTKYEQEGRGRKTMKARELFGKMIDAQIETGTPYVLFKDAINRKSNQKNIGVIRSSNLCGEVCLYTSKDEHAVCNLISIALPKYLVWNKETKQYTYDHKALFDVVYQGTLNLNRVIDINYYPTPETKTSNEAHRPIGIGVQGLADVFAMCMLPFESEAAKQLNKEIFQTIYFASLVASNDLAKRDGPYSTFKGSPASQGILQYHMWGLKNEDLHPRWDWAQLIENIKKDGIRNSTTCCLMPTASTSQILNNNEAFEVFASNIYLRRTLSGEFPMVNKHLARILAEKGLWTDKIRNQIIINDGSVQGIEEIPADIREVFKTVWEVKQRSVIDMSADRGAFICQTQSMNLFIANCNAAKVSSALVHGWKRGLKTGMYYLRTKAIASANKALGMNVIENQPPAIAEATPATTPTAIVLPAAKTAAQLIADATAQAAASAQTAKDLACAIDSDDGDCLACGS